uniref:Uncharacterized protein n=1 Tax=Anguilla anguilla TaxID=7936 RepID=A0A0E9QZ27_ANGAN
MLLRSPPCLSVYHCYISHPVSVCNAVMFSPCLSVHLCCSCLSRYRARNKAI